MLAEGIVTQVTLLTADLPAAVVFYGEVLEAEELYQDDVCAIFRLGAILVNVLTEREGRKLVAPVELGSPQSRRSIVTLEVEDVGAVAQWLTDRGVVLLNGPLTRPWGPRTATFADPAGHVWEIAQSQD